VRLLERARESAERFGWPPEKALTSQGLVDLGLAYQQAGNLPGALGAWQTALAQGGLSDELILEQAQALQSRGDYPAALAYWQMLVERQPQNAQAHFQTGLLLAARDPETALASLEQAASLDPGLQDLVSALRQAVVSARYAEDLSYSLLSTGRALALLDRWELAAEAFRQAVLVRPDYAEAWAYYGEALQHLPPPEAGMERSDGLVELQYAAELAPESLAAQTFLALYWLRQSRYDQALEALRGALKAAPDNPSLAAELAGLLAATGDLPGAHQAYQQAADLAPYDPDYPRRLIRFSLEYHYQIEQLALPLARKLVIEGKENPIDLDLMAQVLISQGDLVSAERFLRRAIQADSTYPSARMSLGLLYLLQGNQAAAERELELAISLDPDGPVARQARRLLGVNPN
jgi:tetratricopeptide (TPR) repeat protein